MIDGLPPELAERVWRYLELADASRSNTGRGMGLSQA